MTQTTRLITRVYVLLLHLYPRAFCNEFGDEMQGVFADALQEAARAGRISLARVLWRELLELPVSIAAEHWRERGLRNMDPQSQESSHFRPVSGLGIVAALAPFAAAIVMDLGPILGPAARYVAFGAFGGLIILLVLGITRGVPSWSLPTFGLFVTLVALPALALWAPIFIFLPPVADWMRLVIGNGWPWFSLCLIGVSVSVVMPLMPRVPFYERICRDWIWLAFALYGSAALWLLLTFDEYAGKLPYVAAACTTLVLGALVYLRASRPWVRFGVLLGSLLLAVLMVAWAKWNLVPSQTWPLDINDELRWSETQNSLVTGAWLVLGVLGPPALVRLLPRRLGRSPTTPV